jgi:insertion element IS1 protein InsB
MVNYSLKEEKRKRKMKCPSCGSTEIVKNGSQANGKPKNKCKKCGRQFVENPKKGRISEETKELIDKLLLEKLPLSAIARVTGVSEQWLQSYVNKKYDNIAKKVEVSKKSKGRLTIECDEVWSYVGNKNNKQWIWLAIDRDTGEIVGMAIGDRSYQTAQQLLRQAQHKYGIRYLVCIANVR